MKLAVCKLTLTMLGLANATQVPGALAPRQPNWKIIAAPLLDKTL